MVFARTRPMLARYDVSPHMVKWWKGIGNLTDQGQVTRHLSPYEQQIIMPWVRSFPKRAYDKFTDGFIYWGGAIGLTLGTGILSDNLDAAQDREHRF